MACGASNSGRHIDPFAVLTGRRPEVPVEADTPRAAEPGNAAQDSARAAFAALIYRRRRARDRAFGADAIIFGEPTWDILLDLYHRELSGEAVAVSSACVAGCRSVSAAMRHIQRLEERGLVVRLPDPTDARRSWVTLTPRGWSVMDGLIDRMIDIDQ